VCQWVYIFRTLSRPLGINYRTQEEGKGKLEPYQEREQRTQYSGLRPISLMKNLPKMKFKTIRKTRKSTEVSSMRIGFRVFLSGNKRLEKGQHRRTYQYEHRKTQKINWNKNPKKGLFEFYIFL